MLNYFVNLSFILILIFSSLASCSDINNNTSSAETTKTSDKNQFLSKSYQYTGNHGLDFSHITRGPIRIDTFTDERSLTTKTGEQHAIQKLAISENIPLAVKQGIEQAFKSGNADLVSENENLRLTGAITSIEAKEQKFTLRVKLTLYNKEKTVWNSTLFSKVDISESNESSDYNDNLKNAFYSSIDKLIEELFFDDYFLLEIID
ncbi:MAG: hypothetical protein ACRBCS_09100 [Cellvibrionaceae bacterium]